MAKLRKNSHLILYRRYASWLKYIMMFLSVAIVTLFLPKQPRFKYEYEKGKLWMNQDLISPYGFAVEKTPDELEKDRQDVLKSVLPIYRFESEVMDTEVQTFLTDFELKWTTSGESLSAKGLYKNFGITLLTSIYQRGVMTLSKRYQRSGPNYNFQLVEDNVATQLNTVAAFTLETANKYAENEIKNNSIRYVIYIRNLELDGP